MKDKLRIVLYTQGLPFTGDTLEKAPLGGAESAVIYLGRNLSNYGHHVIVFCPCPSPGIFDGVDYRDIKDFETWRSGKKCDLFICSRYYHVFLQAIPSKVRLLWLHDHILEENAREIRPLMPHIDRIVCVSEYHTRYTGQFFAEEAYKLMTSSNGVDLSLIQSCVEKVSEKKHKVMFTSRPERGLAEALWVYEQLGDKTLEFLACSYPYPQENVENDYHRLFDILRKKGYPVRFGQFSKPDLYRHIAESKLVLYPSNTPEIFCISAVEAQACNTVFLGRNLGALNEVVGYPCQEGVNPPLFLEATNRVLRDEHFRKSLEILGMKHAQQYDWSRVARQFVEATHSQMDRSHGEFQKKTTTRQVYTEEFETAKIYTSADELSLLTCIMIAQDSIISQKQSIDCFLSQHYPRKRLVVYLMGEDNDDALIQYIDFLAEPDIHLVHKDYHSSLVNNLKEELKSDLLIWWSSRDWYHPTRLDVQSRFHRSNDQNASIIKDYLLTTKADKQLYWMTSNGEVRFESTRNTLAIHKSAAISILKNLDLSPQNWLDALLENTGPAGIDSSGILFLKRGQLGDDLPIEKFGRPASFIEEKKVLLTSALESYPLPEPVSICSGREECVFYYKH